MIHHTLQEALGCSRREFFNFPILKVSHRKLEGLTLNVRRLQSSDMFIKYRPWKIRALFDSLDTKLLNARLHSTPGPSTLSFRRASYARGILVNNLKFSYIYIL